MSHGDKVTAMPPGFRLIGSSASCAIAAMADESRHFYAVQFHPEVTHTKQGAALLARFAHDICGCGDDWNMHDYVGEAVGGHPRADAATRRCCSASPAAWIRRWPRR